MLIAWANRFNEDLKMKVLNRIEQQILDIENQANIQSLKLTDAYNKKNEKLVRALIKDLNGLVKKHSKQEKSIIRMVETEADISKYLAEHSETFSADINQLSLLKRRSLQKHLKKYIQKRQQFEDALEAIEEAKYNAINPLTLKKRILSTPEQYIKSDIQKMLANVMSGAQLKTFIEKLAVINDALTVLTLGTSQAVVNALNTAKATNDYSLEGLIDFRFQHKYSDPVTGQINLAGIFGQDFDLNQLLSITADKGEDADTNIIAAIGDVPFQNLKEAFGMNVYQAIARIMMQQTLSITLENVKVELEQPQPQVMETKDVNASSIHIEEDIAQLSDSEELEMMLKQLYDGPVEAGAVIMPDSLPSWAPSFLLTGKLDEEQKMDAECKQDAVARDELSEETAVFKTPQTFNRALPKVALQPKGVNELVKFFEHMQQQSTNRPQEIASHRDNKVGRLSMAAGAA